MAFHGSYFAVFPLISYQIMDYMILKNPVPNMFLAYAATFCHFYAAAAVVRRRVVCLEKMCIFAPGPAIG